MTGFAPQWTFICPSNFQPLTPGSCEHKSWINCTKYRYTAGIDVYRQSQYRIHRKEVIEIDRVLLIHDDSRIQGSFLRHSVDVSRKTARDKSKCEKIRAN